ncbi:MAG: hypothetical protein PHQ17_04205 [Methanobacterium sp.]|jgi:CO dehydrogenase/acetyl-CoA synthase alpha subunit|nr:hypothetical protein [Methanobacterium sp.]
MSTKSDEKVTVTEEDVISLVDVFTRAPPLMLKMVVKGNKNVVGSFESLVREYKVNLSDEELLKIEKVMDMPVSELQEILKKAYNETGQKQLKILADPKSEDFIRKNLDELRKIIFP